MNIISGILFCLFSAAYLGKLLVLKTKKIKANSLGKKGKSKKIYTTEMRVKIFTFSFLLMWIINIIFNNPEFFLSLNVNNSIKIIGLITTTLGIFLFFLATIFMGIFWRVGIDKSSKTKLITDGIYKYSRNPAFVGFDLMFLGVLWTFPSLLMLIIVISSIISLHLLILQEEKYLKEQFKNEYLKYTNKVRRYL